MEGGEGIVVAAIHHKSALSKVATAILSMYPKGYSDTYTKKTGEAAVTKILEKGGHARFAVAMDDIAKSADAKRGGLNLELMGKDGKLESFITLDPPKPVFKVPAVHAKQKAHAMGATSQPPAATFSIQDLYVVYLLETAAAAVASELSLEKLPKDAQYVIAVVNDVDKKKPENVGTIPGKNEPTSYFKLIELDGKIYGHPVNKAEFETHGKKQKIFIEVPFNQKMKLPAK